MIIFLSLLLLCVALFGVIGLIIPKWAIIWGGKTRKKILLTYIPISFVILIGIVMVSKESIAAEKVTKARQQSVQEIETALDQLEENLQFYQETSQLLHEQQQGVNGLLPFNDGLEKLTSVADKTKHITKIKPIQQVASVSKIATPIGAVSSAASATLGNVAGHLETIQQYEELDKKLTASIQKINALHKQYNETKDLKLMEQIHEELTSNYIYLLVDLKDYTNESIDTFNKLALILYQGQNIKMNVSEGIGKITFWKETDEEDKKEQKKTLKQLDDNMKRIKLIPTEITNRYKEDNATVIKIESELRVIQTLDRMLSDNK
jgi:hypothetical protein